MTIHHGVGKTNFAFSLSFLFPSCTFLVSKSWAFLALKTFYSAFAHIPRTVNSMPPIRTARNRKPPPAGFDDIEDTLLEFSNKMKDAENAPHEGKKKHEVLWPIFQISHQRTWNL